MDSLIVGSSASHYKSSLAGLLFPPQALLNRAYQNGL